MDLLHSGRFDGFCLFPRTVILPGLPPAIVSKASDVFGFGEQKTPESFRQACRKFVYTENLLTGAVSSQDAASTSKPFIPPAQPRPLL